jgi:hypothetical protein
MAAITLRCCHWQLNSSGLGVAVFLLLWHTHSPARRHCKLERFDAQHLKQSSWTWALQAQQQLQAPIPCNLQLVEHTCHNAATHMHILHTEMPKSRPP